MKKVLAILLGSVLCMGAFAGCRNNEPEKPVEPEYPIGSENGKPIDPEKPVEFLSTGLAENGKSDYAIVIPKTCGSYAAFAAEEFQDLFSEATGVKLPIITDEGVSWSESAKYISIGATKLFAESGLTCDFATFKQSGARLFTKGNSVLLAGASEEGALYAVYDFLGILFDYEFYDKDAYSLVHKTSVSLPALDFYDIPDFDYRMYGDFQQYDLVGGSAEHAYRLRFRTYGQDYAFDGHASTSIVSEAEYYDEHADWFSAQTGMLGGREYRQLCYTNEGMTTQFIENVKQLLTEKPTTTSISIAQEDVNIWCNCETCSATMERYGNGQPNLGSITQNLFVNKVVKAVDEWLAAEYPGRNMTYMILAYHQSEIAPAHKDENGNYVVNAPELMLPDNVLVQYASIYTNRNIPFKENANEREKIMAWAAVSKNLQIYEYPSNVTNVCIPYDGLHVFGDNIRFAHELGFGSYYLQGTFNTQSSGFCPLKIYVASKLLWNSSLDPMALAYDYIEHCYGDAAPYMKEYFDLLRMQLSYLRAEYNYGGGVFDSGLSVNYWPIETLRSYQMLFDKAYAAIDGLRNSDPEAYEIIFRKVMIEEMFIRYTTCSLYLNHYSDEEKVRMIDEFELYAALYGFKNYDETKPMSVVIAGWRAQL